MQVTPATLAGDHYLSHCPSLSTDLALLAEADEGPDRRPLLGHERQTLTAAVYACAAEIRRRRPALIRAEMEGRIDG